MLYSDHPGFLGEQALNHLECSTDFKMASLKSCCIWANKIAHVQVLHLQLFKLKLIL